MSTLNISSPQLPSQLVSASNQTGVPTFVLAGMYEQGFNGDPLALAKTLKDWFNRTGGTSWINALAAYHAGSVKGVNDPHALSYAQDVVRASEHASSSLLGAMGTGDALGLAATIIAAGGAAAAGTIATAGADVGAAGAAGADATAAGAAGGGAGAAAKGALSGAGSTAAKTGLEALLGAAGWAAFGVRALEALAGAALILLGLQALTGGSGNPVDAVRSVGRRMA